MTETEASIAQAKAALKAALTSLGAEIRAYPGPIAGCDAQFNHLLALRSQAAALAALDAAARS